MKIAAFSIVVLLLSPALYSAEAWSQTASTTEQAMAAPAAGEVARAAFSRDVQDREPTDTITQLTNNERKIFYFTELKGLGGQKVTHRWEYNGQVMAEIPFDIGGDRWRVYSSKTLDPIWLGEWKVSVTDENGATLSVNTFSYTTAPKQEQTAPAGAASQQ